MYPKIWFWISCVILHAVAIATPYSTQPEIHSFPPQLEQGNPATNASNSLPETTMPEDLTTSSSLTLMKRLNGAYAFVVSIWIGYLANRVKPGGPPWGEALSPLRNMYIAIQRRAMRDWASLPEQSYIKIIYGNLLFALLPREDRTIPWSTVEEVAYAMLLMTVSGFGSGVNRRFTQFIGAWVVHNYLLIIMPTVYEGENIQIAPYNQSTVFVPGLGNILIPPFTYGRKEGSGWKPA